jgi:hypothetical protein
MLRGILLALLIGRMAFAEDAFSDKSVLLKGAAALFQTERASWPSYELKADQTWQLNAPRGQRFDASALLLLTNGDLLTLSDRGPTLYRIQFLTNNDSADLVAIPNVFTPAQLKKYAREKYSYYDTEGMAQDDAGRFYVCEEANRWILRCDPARQQVERLEIDWSPVKQFFSADRNASFEGIAIGNGMLFVANERSTAMIIVVDLATLQIKEHFQVFPRKPSFLGTHYSDLSWHAGKLYVLCRQHRVILEVDPVTHKILSEFDYGDAETQLGYETRLPVGIMEGLAVADDCFWAVTDNNGLPRSKTPKDIRPTLLKFRRPDHAPAPQAAK